MQRRWLAVGLTLVVTASGAAIGGAAVGSAAAARPLIPDRPNGVTRQVAERAPFAPFGDCAVAGVTCKPQNVAGPCTPSNTSQATPPASIRVYDPTYTGPNHIRTVPFETYVENVLPDEWADTWDGDALKAGAVAITSYAWYWATHYGGYVGTPSQATCFDVTNDKNFQVYTANSAKPNSTAKVQQVFPAAIRVGGNVLQASYVSAVRSDYDVTDVATYDACGQGADGTFLSQSGSQSCNENSTGNKWPVILKTYYGPNIQLATTTQLRTPHDFQYLHRSTRATFTNGAWAIDDGYPTTFRFGGQGDIAKVVTTGDGFARAAVWRPSTGRWYLATPTGGVASSFRFGSKTDIPVPAQYQGLSAATQVAMFHPSNGRWYFASPTGAVQSTITYGRKGDIPVPGIWTGRTTATVAVFRPASGVWHLRGAAAVRFGKRGDIPVPADYNGNGTTDIAVYRPSTHKFYVRGHAAVAWGRAGDIPVTGDFTGDGKADIAVYRPSTHTWYVRGLAARTFGATGSTPIGKAPYSD